MKNDQTPPLEPATFDFLAERLASVGVAGNEGDARFDIQDLPASLQALRQRLQAAGYVGGELAAEALVRSHDGVDTLIYDTARYASLFEAEQAWERDYRERWRDKVERRVEDWLDRLQTLLSQMEDWLRTPEFASLSIVDRPPATMSEELMRRFDVSPREMPVFELRSGPERVMRIQPKGLWIIGANGRVDLVTKATAPILVDQSEPLERFAR